MENVNKATNPVNQFSPSAVKFLSASPWDEDKLQVFCFTRKCFTNYKQTYGMCLRRNEIYLFYFENCQETWRKRFL